MNGVFLPWLSMLQVQPSNKLRDQHAHICNGSTDRCPASKPNMRAGCSVILASPSASARRPCLAHLSASGSSKFQPGSSCFCLGKRQLLGILVHWRVIGTIASIDPSSKPACMHRGRADYVTVVQIAVGIKESDIHFGQMNMIGRHIAGKRQSLLFGGTHQRHPFCTGDTTICSRTPVSAPNATWWTAQWFRHTGMAASPDASPLRHRAPRRRVQGSCLAVANKHETEGGGVLHGAHRTRVSVSAASA